MHFSSFRNVETYFAQCTNYEYRQPARYNARHYNLSRMNALLEKVGNPHLKLDVIHLAGTKGKGSTAMMVEAMLRESGFSTGLFTSPHVLHLLERIQVNRKCVALRDFLWSMNQLAPFLPKLRPTFFEIMTACAFLIFEKRKVDFAIVEVGLGGRLDATNVVQPMVTAITRIDFDHTQQLGMTLPRIASEKAGIIKNGVPVIVAPQKPKALTALQKIAHQKNAPTRHVGRDIRMCHYRHYVEGSHDGACFDIETPRRCLEKIRVPFLGQHQAENCAVAMGVIEVLEERAGISVSEHGIKKALSRLRLPARIQKMSDRPTLIVDSAHNPASVEALAKTIQQTFQYDRFLLIFGSSADKNIPAMLRLLLPFADYAFFTRSNHPRACPPHELLRVASALGYRQGVSISDSASALRNARALAFADDLIVVTGSFYLAGEALHQLRVLDKRNPLPHNREVPGET